MRSFGLSRWDRRYGERESGDVEEGRRGGANPTSPFFRGTSKSDLPLSSLPKNHYYNINIQSLAPHSPLSSFFSFFSLLALRFSTEAL